jgi:hypothetical protein
MAQQAAGACVPQEHMQKIDPALLGKVPLSYFLGALGMPGGA